MSSTSRPRPHALIQVYALTVCFSSLVCFMVALGVGLYDLVQIGAPEFTLPNSEIYSSNESYLRFWDAKDRPEAEITRARRGAFADALASERRAAQQSGVFVLFVVLIDTAVFALHWRLARDSRIA